MNAFGDAVRRARIDRGLSQADLGRPLFSRSYISLVESGRRGPSDEIVEHIAGRLDIDIELVRSWALATGDSGTTRAALAQSAVLTALTRSAYDEAADAAAHLSEFALNADRLDLWWTAAILDVDARIQAGDAEGAAASAQTLAEHWFTQSSPALGGRVLTSLATARRVMGDAPGAVEAARRATELLDDPADPAAALAALGALASATAEAGRVDEAVHLLPRLRHAVEATTNRSEAGKAYWTLGNLEFMTGDGDAGRDDHNRAAELIDPDRELRQWARLHRTSAAMRIAAGCHLDTVPDLLAKAETAFSISTAPGDLAALAAVKGSHAVLREEWDEARRCLEAALGDDGLTPQLVAEAHLNLATTLDALGDEDGARRHRAAADAHH